MHPEIYIDIDGVLNRWLITHMSERLGRQLDYSDWPVEYGWDCVSVYNHFAGPGRVITPDEFWATVPESSWVNAPKSNLFDLLMEYPPLIVGRQNVHIVTSVPRDRNPVAYSGKAIWCRRNLPEWLQSQVYMVTHDKSRLARPGRLLIDDADHNILAWRAQGGATLQVPRPWSANWVPGIQPMEVYDFVETRLRSFKQAIFGG